ncbi:MAG: VWA domain-containing protein [Bacteroidales bacterium]
MLHKYFRIGVLFLILVGIPVTLSAQQFKKQDPPTTRILFVFDASQSMLGAWESDKKINIARKYLINIVDSLEHFENVQMALRVYGHQSPVPPQDCSDTKLEVPFSANNASHIRQKLRYLIPQGTTPIAHSLELTEVDFPACDSEKCRNIVILITDGIEACDGDPCQVALKLQQKGIVLRPFVIGIGIDPLFEKTFECVGDFYNSPDEDRFAEVLNVVVSRALNSTTAQVNLLDNRQLPSETNVGMTFFDHYSGKIKHNYVHTINYLGNPDTLILDPLVTYDLVVHTLPPVRKDSFKVVAGKHTQIGLPAPQGALKITTSGSSQYNQLEVLVRETGKNEILNVQKINRIEKYITGQYDLEILTLPRIQLEKLQIQQSEQTTIEVPRPGIANFSMASTGHGSLYQQTADTLQWIYNLSPEQDRETLTLQPGTYRIIYRAKNAKRSIYTISKQFDIRSGASTHIILD